MISLNRNGKSRLPEGADQDQERPGARPYLTVTDGRQPADLIAVARVAGLHNLPRTDAVQLSSHEDTIVSEHARRHVRCVERTRGRLAELTAEFGALEDQLPSLRDMAAIVDVAASKFDDDLGDERLLVPERREQQRALRALRHEVAERGHTRPARYPRSKRLHLAWVAALATCEAVCNAAFLAGLSSIGWLGGLCAAIVIATLNTGSAVLVGFTCLRGLHHHRRDVQRLSAVGIAVCVVLAVVFNVSVGRARDMAARGALSQQSLPQILRHPFDMSLLSAALVGLGLLAVAIALAKGRSLDDVVPGYGDLHRQHVQSDQHFVRTTDALRRGTMAQVEAVPGRLHIEVERAAGIVAQLEATVVDAEKSIAAYEADRQHLETESTGLLRNFRSANESVRTTPPPKYFRTFPTLPSQLDIAPVQLLKTRLAAAAQRFDALKAEADRLEADQPQRVQTAARRFEEFYAGQLRRADAGRGDAADGSNTFDPEVPS